MKDAAIAEVLDAHRGAHELERAVRSRQRHRCAAAAASPSASRPRSRRPRRSRSSMSPPTAATTLYTSTVDMGQGSDTAYGADRRRGARSSSAEDVRVVHPDTDVTPYDMGTLGSRSLFHMGNAVRLAAEDARTKLRALAAEAGLPEGTNYPPAEMFKKRYGMQAGNVIGTASYRAELQVARCADRPVGQRDAVLDDRRRRRRGRGRYRDRARARDTARQCRRLRQADQSRRRAHAALRRRHHAARLHAVRRHAARRRPGDQRLARRLQDPRHPRHSADGERTGRGRAAFRPVRRQGARRIRHLRRLAGDRQCHPRRRRRPHHRTADHRRSGAARAARSKPAEPLEDE